MFLSLISEITLSIHYVLRRSFAAFGGFMFYYDAQLFWKVIVNHSCSMEVNICDAFQESISILP